MKILDRYILGEFLKAFLGILAFFALIHCLKEMLSTLSDVLDQGSGVYQILAYFINTLPGMLVMIVPIAVILATMFSIGSMAKRKEVLAIHACGVSYVRIAMPLLCAQAAITVVTFLCNELVVPRCEERARYIKAVRIEGDSLSVLTKNRNVSTKGKGNRFYHMKSFDSAEGKMVGPTIAEHSDDGRTIRWLVDAEWAELVEKGPGSVAEIGVDRDVAAPSLLNWRFHNAVRRTFDEKGDLVETERFDELLIPMEEDLDRFLATNKRAEEMTLPELMAHCTIQGERSKGGYYRSMKVDLHQKVAFPLAVFFLGMIGYTFAVRSSIHSLVLEFGFALLSTGAYYLLTVFFVKAGGSGYLTPFLAAWAPNLVFAVFLARRFWDLNRVPRR